MTCIQYYDIWDKGIPADTEMDYDFEVGRRGKVREKISLPVIQGSRKDFEKVEIRETDVAEGWDAVDFVVAVMAYSREADMKIVVEVVVVLEEKEDQLVNMEEAVRRQHPSRKRRQGYEEGSAEADDCQSCQIGSQE
jgi:hypothetical protein